MKTSKPTKTDYTQWYKWIVVGLALALYANTLGLNYAQDDAIVITDNIFTQRGLSGIGDILSKDTFFGFFKVEGKGALVSGGRYRPLSLISFAIEKQFFGNSPFVGHLINVAWYALLCWVIFMTLSLLFNSVNNGAELALIATLIYTCHPLHTEVVANIKGRDELFAMLGSMICLWAWLKYYDEKQKKWVIIAAVSLFLGLLSKENTITFLAVIPLAIYLFRGQKIGDAITPLVYLLLPTALFLLMRYSAIGGGLGAEPMELMNNPFLKWNGTRFVKLDFAERFGTITYTWLVYLKLLILPQPLTHDYYPRHIEIASLSNIKSMLGLVLNVGLGLLALIKMKKCPIISFGILTYFITFSIVSNLIFPIGTNMGERFMFMPSLGFSIVLAFGLLQLKSRSTLAFGTISLLGVTAFCGKTLLRNPAWKDNTTLFTTDYATSKNSAKLLNALGGTYSDQAAEENEPSRKAALLAKAKPMLDQAIAIHPQYTNAYLLLGNVYYHSNDLPNAIATYNKALALKSDFEDARQNLGVAYRDYGKYLGESQGDIAGATTNLLQSIAINKDDFETLRLLGVSYGMQGDHQQAINYFVQAVQLEPNNAFGYLNLAKAYGFIGDITNEQLNLRKAQDIDPKVLER